MDDAQLYHDDYTQGPSYPFDWSQSGIVTLSLSETVARGWEG